MAISKKQAKHIASLINACTCWHIAVKDDLAKEDYTAARQAMEWHDRDAKELNGILGVEAVVLYNREAV
jgi:hypothetical protein